MTVPASLTLNDREQRIADWGETNEPAIYQNAALHKFPLPIRKLRIRDAWDFQQFKVPLKDGDQLTGHSQQGVEILIEGQVALQDGAAKLTEGEMFAEIESLRTVLDAGSSSGKYELFLFHDTVTPYYRKFKSCATRQLEINLANRDLFSYSVLIHAEDPVIYTTAPGL